MVCNDFSNWGLHSCRRAVYGVLRGFRVLDQWVGRHKRRRRTHRRCIGCEENTRQDSPPRTRPQMMSQRPINKASKVHLLVRPGLHLPIPAVRFWTARRARTSQCWPPLRRPPAGLGIDRPSTVLRLQEAVTIIGMVLCESHFFAAAGVTRMGGNRASGFRRAAVFRRAIARDPSPQGEGAAQEEDQNWTVSTKVSEALSWTMGFRSTPR